MLCPLQLFGNDSPSPRGCTAGADEASGESFVPWSQPSWNTNEEERPSVHSSQYPCHLSLNLMLSLESYILISLCNSQESLSHKV